MTHANPKIIPLPQPSSSLWTKTPYTNLYRYEPNGVYHVHAKVAGRLVRKSLKTALLDVAKERLDKLLAKERRRIVGNPDPTVKDADTFGYLADEWLRRVKADRHLKPNTKKYRAELVAAIRQVWKGVDDLTPNKFTDGKVAEFFDKFRKKYSATRVNGCLETLRGILALGVKRGLLASNPTDGIERASVPAKAVRLPSKGEFGAILKRLDSLPSRSKAAVTVRFLAYCGPRISAAGSIYPCDVDLKRNEIILPPIKYQNESLRIPMHKKLRQLVVRLLKEHPGDDSPLLPIKNPKKALGTACKELGIPRITNHDLRRMFITRSLECGVDVATVARWVGHKDGGVLLLKVYNKVRDQHSHRMAKKVMF